MYYELYVANLCYVLYPQKKGNCYAILFILFFYSFSISSTKGTFTEFYVTLCFCIFCIYSSVVIHSWQCIEFFI